MTAPTAGDFALTRTSAPVAFSGEPGIASDIPHRANGET